MLEFATGGHLPAGAIPQTNSMALPLATKNRVLRGKRQLVKKVAGKKDFEECESGCAFNGITDAVTNLLTKVQHVTVSENSVHNSCVSSTMVWTWNFLISLQT